MTQHLTESDLLGYKTGSLPPTELLRADDHLASCEACRAKLAGVVEVDVLKKTWQSEIDSKPGTSGGTRWWIWVGSGMAAALVLTGYFWGFGDDPGLPSAAKTVVREKNFSISLDNRGMLRGLGPLDALHRDMLRAAIQGRNLRLPEETAHLVGRRGVQMSGGDPEGADRQQNPLLYPVGTVILEDNPVLRWRPVAGAKSYEVHVQDEMTGRIVNSGSTQTTEFKVPAPMQRGRRYVWQIRAKLQEGDQLYPKAPAPPAKFRVADEALVDTVKGLPLSQTLRGVMFAEAGLLDASRAEFEELRKMNPQSSLITTWIEQIDRAKKP